MKGFFITATDTEVGKTIAAGGLAGVFRKMGYDFGVYKPIQCGHLVNHPEGDAARLQALSGVKDALEDICPFALEEAMTPMLALERAGKQVALQDLQPGYDRLREKHEFMIVEGAGGLAVPYTADGLVVDAALMFQLPLIIVARPNLGTLSHTILTIEFAKQKGLDVAGVIISGYKEETAGIVEQTNPKLIQSLGGVPVLGIIPWVEEIDNRELVLPAFEQSIDWKELQKWVSK